MWDNRIGVTIVAPHEEQNLLEWHVGAAGLRLLRSTTPGQVRDQPFLRTGVVLFDAPIDDEGNDWLLEDLDRASAEGHLALVVRTAVASLDPVVARIESRNAVILCEPTEQDLICSLRTAAEIGRSPVLLHDSKDDPGEDVDAARDLEDHLERIVGAVESCPAPLVRDRAAAPPLSADEGAKLADEIHAILRVRRSRNEFFDERFFADPIWDMLLELLEARLRNKHLTTTGLCAGAGVPTTTALRCINVLVKKGVIVRMRDKADRRRVYVDVTDETADALIRWFARAQGQARLAGV